MRKMLLSLAAVTVLVLGTAQLSRADLILSISINGGAATTFTCLGNCAFVSGNVTVGGLTVGAVGGSNLPGAANAFATHSNTTIQGTSGASGFADVVLKATGFTSPLSPPNVFLQNTGSLSQGDGLTSYTAGGGGDALNTGNVVTAAVSCTMSATPTPNSCTGSPSTLFATGAGPYSLTSTGHIIFTSGAVGISATSTLTASQVPEPASMLLLGSGLLGLGGLVRRKVRR